LGQKPKGGFTLEGIPEDSPLVLVSTGTGLAPYLSMVRGDALAKGRKVAILQGVRHSWDLGYDGELKDLQAQHSNFTYQTIVSRPQQETSPWSGHTGYLQNLWKSGELKPGLGFQPKPSDTHVYMCGNPDMIREFQEILAAEGYAPHSNKSPGNIHVEKYW
jgi:ferredoxin--NADP+ reductase